MRPKIAAVLLLFTALSLHAQTAGQCQCGSNPPGPPANRTLIPYTGAPDDLRPWSKFNKPYYEYYQDLIEYNGAARSIPDPELKSLSEIRIGFLAPLYDHRDQAFGNRMLSGAQMAVDEWNARGGYGGKPFKLITHNDYNNWQDKSPAGAPKDSAIWGAASNDAVRMIYDDKVWAMFGSLSAESTHIALRVALKAEVPLVNSAATDPTIPETIIPWYFTDIQDDRMQGYTLARHIYTELGLKRIAILRVNDRYGRFGVLKFKDASRRLGHVVVIEQKFMPGDDDFRHELKIIADSRVDGIVLWTDEVPAAAIIKQMRELGMKQRVFGSHRTMGDTFVEQAGAAGEGFEAVVPYDPTRTDLRWVEFNKRFMEKYHQKPDHFAALAYDAMQALLDAICRAGLNRGRIRDALTAVTTYQGVTGEMRFDPNCKNIAPLYLASVHNGQIGYRVAKMEIAAAEPPEHPYARVGEDGVQYSGPALPDSTDLRIAVFGPHAEQAIASAEAVQAVAEAKLKGRSVTLVAIPSEGSWGKASTLLVDAIYKQNVIGIVALDRNSSHLAEQLGVKSFVPVLALSSDRMLTSTNIPWIFRLPEGTPLRQALACFSEGIEQAGANRAKLRELLASGAEVAGVRFQSTGELQ